MKRVLILGAGYIGQQLFDSMMRDLSSSDACWLKSKKDLDYTNKAVLNRFVVDSDVTHIVNCSGFTGVPNVDECEARKVECWHYNVIVPAVISTVAQHHSLSLINISSGCIYTGYEKDWTEEDQPNFGIFDSTSSFYSRSKHAFELSNNYGLTIRIRMPICGTDSPRSFLNKIRKYNNLVNFQNSKTYVPELLDFVKVIVDRPLDMSPDIVNFVNPDPLWTSSVCDILEDWSVENDNWNFVDIDTLNLAAPRSNCILSTNKLRDVYGFEMMTEHDAVNEAACNIKKNLC